MRKLGLFILVSVLFFPVAKAQNADQRIAELLSKGEWFSLRDEYLSSKDKIEVPVLKWLSETMINNYFNRPEEAIVAIDTLLNNYQEQMGFETTANMVALRCNLLGGTGKYAQAADDIKSFLDQIEQFTSKENFPTHIEIYKHYNKLRNEKTPELIRPNTDTEIPLTIEETRKDDEKSKGHLMFVPVKISSKEYPFIFDTGAVGTFISERFADEIGLRIIQDSILITGIKQLYGKMGIIDSIAVGDIIYKNLLVTVGPSIAEVDSVYQVDAVLGLDFINRVKNIHIYPQEKRIVFPIQNNNTTLYESNMVMDGIPYLKLSSDNESLLFQFDTGNAIGELHAPYYLRHKDWIEANGKREVLTGGGFGGLHTREIIRIPSIPLKIGNTGFQMKNVVVNMDNVMAAQKNEDGALGLDFIKLFNKIIIDFDKMYVEVEK